MARGFETGSDNEKIDELQKQLDDVLDSQISSVGGNEDISIDSSRGARNAASGDSGGVRSNEPIIHQITDVDSAGTPTGVFDKINIISSMAIIDHTSTPIILRFIQGPVKDGARIKITPKIGKEINIESGGNILTTDTITISDGDFYELVKYSEAETGVTGGAYKISLNVTGGGGGITLPILYPQDDFGDQGAVTLNIDISGTTGQNKKIRMIGDVGFNFTIPPGSTVLEEIWVTFEQDGIGNHSITTTPTGLKNAAQLDALLDKTAGTKTTFHFITEDGGVTFRGELVDLVSTSGANQFLSNLTSPTSINQALLFAAAGIDIGDTTIPLDNLFVNRIRLQPGTFVTNKPTITSLSGDSVDIHTSNGANVVLDYEGVGPVHIFSPSSFTTPIIINNGSLFFNDSILTPFSNGEIKRAGNDVYVFTGGKLVNFSDLTFDGTGLQDFKLSLDHETPEYDFEIWLSNAKQGHSDFATTSPVYSPILVNTQHYLPIYIGQRSQVLRVGVDVGVIDFDDMAMAIYDSQPLQNYPNQRITSVVTGFISSTGILDLFFAKNLEPGLYFLSFWIDGNAESATFLHHPASSANCIGWRPENGDSGAMLPILGFIDVGVSQSLPSSAPNDLVSLSLEAALAMFAKIVPNTS